MCFDGAGLHMLRLEEIFIVLEMENKQSSVFGLVHRLTATCMERSTSRFLMSSLVYVCGDVVPSFPFFPPF